MQVIDLSQGEGLRSGLKTLADALTPNASEQALGAYRMQEAQKTGAETLKLQRENEARARIQTRLAQKGAWENPDVMRENTSDWAILGDPKYLQAAASGRAFESVAQRHGGAAPMGFGPTATPTSNSNPNLSAPSAPAPAPDTRYLGGFGGGVTSNSEPQSPSINAPLMGASWDQTPQNHTQAPALSPGVKPYKLNLSGMPVQEFASPQEFNQFAQSLQPGSPHFQDIQDINRELNPPLAPNARGPYGQVAPGQGVMPPVSAPSAPGTPPIGTGMAQGWAGNPNYNPDDEFRLFSAGIHSWPQTRTGQLEGVYGDLARTSIQQEHEDARNQYRVDNNVNGQGTPRNWIDPATGSAGGVTVDGITDARTGQTLPQGATLGGTQSPVPRGDLLTSANRSVVQRQQMAARDVVSTADKLREQLHRSSTVVGLTGNVLRIAGGAVGQAKSLLETAASQDPYGLADPSSLLQSLQGANGALNGASVDAAQFSSDIISLAFVLAKERNGGSQISNRDVAMTLASLGDSWWSSPAQAMARLDDISRTYRDRESTHAARLRGEALQPLPPMQTFAPGSSALPQVQPQGPTQGPAPQSQQNPPQPVQELGVEALNGLDKAGLVNLLSAVNQGRARLSPEADAELTRRIRNIQSNGR